MILEQKQLHEMPFDDTGKVFIVEASEIGFRPGEWPPRLYVSEDVGNGKDFIYQGWATDETVYYTQPGLGGFELHVVND